MSYEIRPLEWEHRKTDSEESYVATTPLGRLTVSRARCVTEGVATWEPWTWRMSGTRQAIELVAICNSPEEGKQLAEAEWRRRLLPMLVEVECTT